jgi:phosphoserine aminotransferase
LFKGNVLTEDRSRMNATFNAIDETTADRFMKVCKETGIHGIKGHRLSGGFRASMYNALPLESVEYLVDVMRSFE